MTDGQQWGPTPPVDPAAQQGYGYPPQGQPQYEQPQAAPYGQPQYAQPQYPQPQYGQPSYPEAPYPQAQYPQPQYGQAPYAQYGQPQYGQQYPQPYGQPGYPAPGGWPTATWPHGPGRPGAATTAAVFGFVAGGLTALVSLGMFIAVLGGDGDPATMLLSLGLPCAAGLITGGVHLMQRRSTNVLYWSSVASLGVLALTLLVALVGMDGDDRIGVSVFVVFACVLPVVTAVLSRVRSVTGWADSY